MSRDVSVHPLMGTLCSAPRLIMDLQSQSIIGIAGQRVDLGIIRLASDSYASMQPYGIQ